MKKRFSWKSSHRSIPAVVNAQLLGIPSNFIIVAATKKIAVKEIIDGKYEHLGLRHDGVTFQNDGSILLDEAIGKFASRNRQGWEVKRPDLPKVIKSFSWESPNFGDASTYGTHTHHQDREVYQVQIFEPRMFTVKSELLNSPGLLGTALIKFEVEQILDKTSVNFEDDLLFCLNLLQECAGVSGVYASDATREDFIGTVVLDWEVFPPGEAAQLLSSFSGSRMGLSAAKAGIVADRLKLFNKLPVESFIRGSGNFGAYVGALYADDLVVFENVNYGNALYVLYDDWRDVCQRSRLELLQGTTAKFDRIVHTDGWEDRFQTLVQRELRKRGRLTRNR